MSQTTRRQLRMEFEKILSPYIDDDGAIATQLADLAVSILQPKPAFDLKSSDPAWAILKGEPITYDGVRENAILEREALESFERCLQLPGSWQWYGGNSSDERALKDLRDFVIETYRKDQDAFTKYQTWRTQPFARGAMSNLAIKKNPENFRLSWTDYLANSTGTKSVKAPDVQTDDNDIPLTY